MKFPSLRIFLFLLILLIAHNLQAQRNLETQVEKRNLSGFSEILVKGSSNVYLTQGNTFEVTIEASEGLISKIITAQNGNLLLIDTDNIKMLRKGEFHKVYVTLPKLEDIKVLGAADVFGQNTFKGSNMKIEVKGAGDLRLEVSVQNLTCDVSGAGDADLSGSTQSLNAKVSGAGDLKAYNLDVQKADISVHGSGDAFVTIQQEMSANIGGSGDLHYKGAANIKNINVSGSGDIHHKGN